MILPQKNVKKVQKIHQIDQIPFITKHNCKKTNSKINVCMYYFANILNGVGVAPKGTSGAMNFFSKTLLLTLRQFSNHRVYF